MSTLQWQMMEAVGVAGKPMEVAALRNEAHAMDAGKKAILNETARMSKKPSRKKTKKRAKPRTRRKVRRLLLLLCHSAFWMLMTTS